MKLIKWMSWLVILIALACYAGAIWLARRRPRRCSATSARRSWWSASCCSSSGAWSATTSSTRSRPASRYATPIGHTWLIGTSLLAEVAWALIIYGIVILLGTWLAGPIALRRPAPRLDRADPPRPAGDRLGRPGRRLPAARPLGAGAGAAELGRASSCSAGSSRSASRRSGAWRSASSGRGRGAAARRPRTPGARCLSSTSSGSARARPSSSCTAARRAGGTWREQRRSRALDAGHRRSARLRHRWRRRAGRLRGRCAARRRGARRTAPTWSATPTAAWSRCSPPRSGPTRSARSR